MLLPFHCSSDGRPHHVRSNCYENYLHVRHFPSLKHCTINRSRNDRALSLHKKISDKFINITVDFLTSTHNNGDGEGALSLSPDVKNALGRADLIICATSSTIPLFPSSYVRDGTHIILIRSYKLEMKEVDRDLISRSLKGTLLVDYRSVPLRSWRTDRRFCTP